MTLTPEQLAMRRRGIFASEIAAIVNCCRPTAAPIHPWKSAYEVFLEKTLPPDRLVDATSLRMELGNAAEPVALRWLCRERGYTLTFPGTLLHPEHPRVGATPDGLVVEDPDIGVEAKLAFSHSACRWTEDPDGIPAMYRLQVETCMEVAGRGLWDVIGLVDGEPKIYRIHRDRALGKMCVEAALHFWHDHVERGDPPPPSGHESTRRALERMHPAGNGTMRSPSLEMMVLARQYADARAEAKAAAFRAESLQNALIAMCGDADGIEGICTYKLDKTGRIAWKRVATEAGATPAIVEKHRGAPSRRFLFKGDSEEAE